MDGEYLTKQDVEFCQCKSSVENKIAIGAILLHYKKHLCFPEQNNIGVFNDKLIKSKIALGYDESDLKDYNWSGRSALRFRNEIRAYLGFRAQTTIEAEKLIKHIESKILPKGMSDISMMEQILVYHRVNKIELPKIKQLDRHIKSAKSTFNNNLIQKVIVNLSKEQKDLIDSILSKSDNQNANGIGLIDLKRKMPGAKLKNVSKVIQKIELLRKITIPQEVQEISRKILIRYHDRIMRLCPSNILEFRKENIYGYVAIFCHIQLQILLDDLSDAYIKIVSRLRKASEKYVENNILKDVKRVDGKFDILDLLANLSANNPKGIIEDVIYPEISQEKLLELIIDLKQRGKWFEKQVQTKMHSNYIHGSRKTLLKILKTLRLQEDSRKYKSIIHAIAHINKHESDDSITYSYKTTNLSDTILNSWIESVTLPDKNKIDKYNFELAILEHTKDLLYFKAVWVQRSYKYRNPKDDIPKDFQENKANYLNLLNQPHHAKTFIKKLKRSAHEDSLNKLNTSISNNPFVEIIKSTTNKNIKVSPSSPQKEPTNINKLHKEIVKRWETINLIDVLKESDLLINFTDGLETLSKTKKLSSEDFRKKVLLCLYALGSNTGLKRISIANGDVEYSDLRYVKNRYLNAENIRKAIRQVINAILATRDSKVWGEATTTVACDSTHIHAWDQNLLTDWHHRYKKKGVMIYWHVDQKSLCIYSQIKSCSSSEVGSMLKGVIDHDTKMNMNRVFTDTHGQSVIGFTVSYILGFNLLPRFKTINKQKLYGVSRYDKEKYKNISEIIKGTINWKLIEDNYQEVIKYMSALRVGTIEPDVLIKRFSHKNFEHPVYKALLEIGKVNKTIFLCDYLESENLRIEINEGLNVVERLNNAMDFIFYGKIGKLQTNKPEDQELSILALHLLQTCMVYINTIIIQEILAQPHWSNVLIPEDYRALTPLFAEHINPYGLFPIDLKMRLPFRKVNTLQENV